MENYRKIQNDLEEIQKKHRKIQKTKAATWLAWGSLLLLLQVSQSPRIPISQLLPSCLVSQDFSGLTVLTHTDKIHQLEWKQS